jgi:hypothetical protein
MAVKQAAMDQHVAAPPVLTEEFKNSPELYDPGPGPHTDHYEGRSGAMSPWARPEDVEVTTVLNSFEPQPMLYVWLPSVRVSAGGEVTMLAALRDENGKLVDADDVTAEITELGSGAKQTQAFEKAHSAEYNFRAVYRPSVSSARVRAYDYIVVAHGTLEGPFERTAVGGFFVHSLADAVHEERSQIRQEAGNIVLEVPAEVTEPGDYHAYAELWAGPRGDIPLAVAQDRFAGWQAGERTIRLFFGGRIIRDSGQDGPYTIRNLRFRRVDVEPFDEAEPVALVGKTPEWRAAEFE